METATLEQKQASSCCTLRVFIKVQNCFFILNTIHTVILVLTLIRTIFIKRIIMELITGNVSFLQHTFMYQQCAPHCVILHT